MGNIEVTSGDGSPSNVLEANTIADSQSEEAVNDDTVPVFSDDTGDNISKGIVPKEPFEIYAQTVAPNNHKSKSVENYGAKKP